MTKLLKTRLYYYCLPDKFKKQISTYVCDVIFEKDGKLNYEDTNGNTYAVDKEDIGLTIFLGAVDATYAIVFENVSEDLDIEKAEKTIVEDSALYFDALSKFAKKE